MNQDEIAITTELADMCARATRMPVELHAKLYEMMPDIDERNKAIFLLCYKKWQYTELRVEIAEISNSIDERDVATFMQHYKKWQHAEKHGPSIKSFFTFVLLEIAGMATSNEGLVD
jgi:hypothetical protein